MVWKVMCAHCKNQWFTSRKVDTIVCPKCLEETPNDRSAFHSQRVVQDVVRKRDINIAYGH
ncbi:hypothetical protein GQ472_00730 [archaeon]|nr:hypothetical protein [archaeon]